MNSKLLLAPLHNTPNVSYVFNTGVGMQLFSQSGYYYLHRNNSIIIVDQGGRFPTILCNSASKSPNIGRWITPSGTSLTKSDTSGTYAVHRQGGSTLPSFISLQVKNSVAASSSQHGLYVCHIPDENGVEQTLHTWVFPRTYSGETQCVQVYIHVHVNRSVNSRCFPATQ